MLVTVPVNANGIILLPAVARDSLKCEAVTVRAAVAAVEVLVVDLAHVRPRRAVPESALVARRRAVGDIHRVLHRHEMTILTCVLYPVNLQAS